MILYYYYSPLKNQQECTKGKLAVYCWMTISILLNNHLELPLTINVLSEAHAIMSLMLYMNMLQGDSILAVWKTELDII